MGQVAEDLPIRFAEPEWFQGTADALHAASVVGESPLLLSKTDARQHHMREFGGLGRQNVLHDQKGQLAQHFVPLRIRRQVLLHNLETFDPPGANALTNALQVESARGWPAVEIGDTTGVRRFVSPDEEIVLIPLGWRRDIEMWRPYNLTHQATEQEQLLIG